MKDQQNAYKSAGVDIDEGARLVNMINQRNKTASHPCIIGGIGGFGAIFDIKQAGYKDPLLVSATDGVGTKLKLAIESEVFDSVGIDLVAMSVNDILVLGAKPYTFLDYYACGKLDADKAAQVVHGISKGCEIAGCALIGGETAEMPGMYNDSDFDLAGFAVGLVEREHLINGNSIEPGDVVLGLGSSGCHSNGYSLIRKIIQDQGYSYASPSPFDSGCSIAESFLRPTRIYSRSLSNVFDSAYTIKGIAHITGGGLIDNIPRILSDDLAVMLDAQKWGCGSETKWLCESANITYEDGLRTFNCGIGLVIICSKDQALSIKKLLELHGEKVFEIGDVVQRQKADEKAVSVLNQESLWNLKN